MVVETSLVQPDMAGDDGSLKVHFAVKDSGIGIEEKKLDSIFDRFTQADSSTTRKYGGTGLGLSICKSLCEAMGGKIWLESRKGFGTSVHMELPFEKDPRVSIANSPLRGKSVLIINDQDYSVRHLPSGSAHVPSGSAKPRVWRKAAVSLKTAANQTPPTTWSLSAGISTAGKGSGLWMN